MIAPDRLFTEPLSKTELHELAVGVILVSRKGATVDEPMTLIQLSRGREAGLAAGLQTQQPIASVSRNGDDVLQQHPPGTTPAPGRGRSHRFDLSVREIDFLQRPTTHQEPVLPGRPERDPWLLQPLQIQRVHALWRGPFVHVAQMLLQQFDYFTGGEVVLPDLHDYPSRSL